jgi:hypothetical protein
VRLERISAMYLSLAAARLRAVNYWSGCDASAPLELIVSERLLDGVFRKLGRLWSSAARSLLITRTAFSRAVTSPRRHGSP